MATKADVWRTIGTATRVLNTEISKEIIRQEAVDTGRMKNISKIIHLKWDESKDDISMEINSTFYYKYVDEGFSAKWKQGRIRRNITQAFMAREKVIDQLGKVTAMIFEFRIDEQFQ